MSHVVHWVFLSGGTPGGLPAWLRGSRRGVGAGADDETWGEQRRTLPEVAGDAGQHLLQAGLGSLDEWLRDAA